MEGARLALGGKLVTARVRNMLWLARVNDGASLWIMPVQPGLFRSFVDAAR